MNARCVLVLAAITACAAPRSAPTDWFEIRGDVAPVRAWFDAHAHQPRALLLLSPT